MAWASRVTDGGRVCRYVPMPMWVVEVGCPTSDMVRVSWVPWEPCNVSVNEQHEWRVTADRTHAPKKEREKETRDSLLECP
jgi:hypothetical protein